MHANVVFTKHALERVNQIDIDPEDLLRSRQSWRPCKENIFRLMYKVQKYGQKQLGVEYWYSEKHHVLLTLKEQNDIFTCITVTKKNKKEVKLSKRR